MTHARGPGSILIAAKRGVARCAFVAVKHTRYHLGALPGIPHPAPSAPRSCAPGATRWAITWRHQPRGALGASRRRLGATLRTARLYLRQGVVLARRR